MPKLPKSNHPGHYTPDLGPNGERPLVPSKAFVGEPPMCVCGYHKGWHYTGEDMVCQIAEAECPGFTLAKNPSLIKRVFDAVRK